MQRTLLFPFSRQSPLRSVHTLAHEIVDGPNFSSGHGKVYVLLHGLLGNSKNLGTVAKTVVKNNPQSRVILLDLRGHGGSTVLNQSKLPHSGPLSLHDCAEDVIQSVDAVNNGQAPHLIAGHSMGGKVLLAYLDIAVSSRPDLVPRHAWVWDSQPAALHRHREERSLPAATDRTLKSSNSVADVLNAVSRVELPVKLKKDIVGQLMDMGIASPIAQWMTTNLVKDEERGGYKLAFDLNTARAMYNAYDNTDFLPLVGKMCAHPEVALNFVLAGKNVSTWTPEAQQNLRSACKRHGIHLLPNSGHWVHVDDLQGLLGLMEQSFKA